MVFKNKFVNRGSTDQPIGIIVRAFANGQGDRGSILGEVILKTQKMVLDASLLKIQHYKIQIKGKSSHTGKGVAPSPTPAHTSH